MAWWVGVVVGWNVVLGVHPWGIVMIPVVWVAGMVWGQGLLSWRVVIGQWLHSPACLGGPLLAVWVICGIWQDDGRAVCVEVVGVLYQSSICH